MAIVLIKITQNWHAVLIEVQWVRYMKIIIFRVIKVCMIPAVTPNDSLWVVWLLHTADWYDLSFFCNVGLLLLSFNKKASSASVAEELLQKSQTDNLLDFFLCGTPSEAISSRCFTLTSSAASLPVGWGTPIYGLYRYKPQNMVWLLRFSVLK